MDKLKILFAASEVYPLIKTGGLADVAGSLPRSLKGMHHDIRIVLPAYSEVMENVKTTTCIASTQIGMQTVNILQTRLPNSQVKVWLIDAPDYFDRKGNPYLDDEGKPWSDNAQRFALFAEVVVQLARDLVGIDWKPDVVHCNDWQTGLIPALLNEYTDRPATVFTIHNLAYQGTFGYDTFKALKLPQKFWSYAALEFHNQLAFIKGGLVYADCITTVSPTYAQEIQTSEFGYGLEGLLQYRQSILCGILNGINDKEWDPKTDPYITHHYSATRLADKINNKTELQADNQLPQDPQRLLVGFIGRLVEQKGITEIIEAIPRLVDLPIQFIILGSGDAQYEQQLKQLSKKFAHQLHVTIGYFEQLAHRIEAGVDVFLMPSRFEPCGLNQMYSLRYGTLPLVRAVGGLADTVVDATPENIKDNKANGFIVREHEGEDLASAVQRALTLFQDQVAWHQLQRNGMKTDYSWRKSARQYVALYQQAITNARSG